MKIHARLHLPVGSMLLVSMLLALVGCMTWTQPAPPGPSLSRVSQHPIQIARTDHSTIIIKNASVQGDSLIGVAADGSNARISIPISEIQGVSTRELDPGRSLALTGGIILSALGVLFIAAVIALSNTNWD